MAIETAYGIWDLNELYPRDDDSISEAKDHINLIKYTLKNSFPNFDSNFSTPFTNNYLSIPSAKLNDIDNITNDTFVVSGTPPKTTLTQVDVLGTLSLSGYGANARNDLLRITTAYKVELSPALVPLGTIIFTPLTLAQLNTIYGVGVFIDCNGINTPASILKDLIGLPTIPDLYEKIPAAATGDGDIRNSYNPLTSFKSGIDFINPTVDPKSHDHGGFWHQHNISWLMTAVYGTGTGLQVHSTVAYKGGSGTSWLRGDYAIPNKHEHTHTTILQQGNQTPGYNYPYHVSLNAFIRVN